MPFLCNLQILALVLVTPTQTFIQNNKLAWTIQERSSLLEMEWNLKMKMNQMYQTELGGKPTEDFIWNLEGIIKYLQL